MKDAWDAHGSAVACMQLQLNGMQLTVLSTPSPSSLTEEDERVVVQRRARQLKHVAKVRGLENLDGSMRKRGCQYVLLTWSGDSPQPVVSVEASEAAKDMIRRGHGMEQFQAGAAEIMRAMEDEAARSRPQQQPGPLADAPPQAAAPALGLREVATSAAAAAPPRAAAPPQLQLPPSSSPSPATFEANGSELLLMVGGITEISFNLPLRVSQWAGLPDPLKRRVRRWIHLHSGMSMKGLHQTKIMRALSEATQQPLSDGDAADAGGGAADGGEDAAASGDEQQGGVFPLFHPSSDPDDAVGHWGLVVVDMERKDVINYDSMGWSGRDALKAAALFVERVAARDDQHSIKPACTQWLLKSAEGIPRQSNAIDCGVFLMK
jgi:hypothetical protein